MKKLAEAERLAPKWFLALANTPLDTSLLSFVVRQYYLQLRTLPQPQTVDLLGRVSSAEHLKTQSHHF